MCKLYHRILNNIYIINKKINIIVFICLLAGILIIGCQNQERKNTVPPIETWNSADLIRTVYSRLFYIEEKSDKMKIHKFLSTAQSVSLDIEDIFIFSFQINIEHGADNEKIYWRMYEVNGEYYLEDSKGDYWKTSEEFFRFLDERFH